MNIQNKHDPTDTYAEWYRSVSSSGSVEWSHAAATYASRRIILLEGVSV